MSDYAHLGVFSDLVDSAKQQADLFPSAPPGPETIARVCEVLGFCRQPELPGDVRVDRRWEKDGICGEAISWSVGYGPRTEAWFLRPAGVEGPLPAVLALHDHGGFKYYGKEKIAEGPDEPPEILKDYHRSYYGGRAWANSLVKRGFAVLVHDTFVWGSRKFPIDLLEQAAGNPPAGQAEPGSRAEIERYNQLSGAHEHVVSKYCNLLGTSMAGVVSHEDRIALNYLRSRSEVRADSIACMGLSGGGNRSALLFASAEGLRAAVIVGLMSSYEGLLDHNVLTHTWMFFPFGWSRYGDWPDLAACRAPAPLLVQYDNEDELFTTQGMREGHEKIAAHYHNVGQPEAYTGQFFPGPHKFDREMQEAAFTWLEKQLAEV